MNGHVLIIQHVAEEGPGRILEALAAAGLRVRIIQAWSGEQVPTRLDDLAGVVVLGGPMSVHDAATVIHLADEVSLIGRAFVSELPLLGICLGSQLIAMALGATIRRAPAIELGHHEVTLARAAADDPLFGALPSRFPALHWHGEVFDLPPDAVSLASSAMTEHQAFRAGSAWGLLFHLEATPAQVRAMAAAFPEDLAQANLGATELSTTAARFDDSMSFHAATVFGAWCRLVKTHSVAR